MNILERKNSVLHPSLYFFCHILLEIGFRIIDAVAVWICLEKMNVVFALFGVFPATQMLTIDENLHVCPHSTHLALIFMVNTHGFRKRSL